MIWKKQVLQNCPPTGAKNISIKPVYRFVKNNSVSLDDFLPHAIKYPMKRYPDKCKALGTSVFLDLAYARHMKAITPAFKKMLLAEGKIDVGDGVVEVNGATYHATWWINTIAPHLRFQVIP
jgi:hypothetical protein